MTDVMHHFFRTFCVLLTLLLFSCGKESYTEEEGSDGLNLKANSGIAKLMKRTVMNDGSNDNIIDRANCFNLQLPLTLTANGQQITIASEDDFNAVEAIFDASGADIDMVNIQFPITIIKSDFSEVAVNNQIELTNLANVCNGEGVVDDDIECIDFVYPISASVFNKTNELTSRTVFNSDKQLFVFITDLNENHVVNIDFPIQLRLSDGTSAPIMDLADLETTIENAKDGCDEDDDFDYHDDDDEGEEEQGEGVTPEEQDLIELITSCVWEIDEAEIGEQHLLDTFTPFVFTFAIDGDITAMENGNGTVGTWAITTVNGVLQITLTLQGSLTELNKQWLLHEINSEDDGTRLKIKQGEDEIEFRQDCN